MWTNVDNDLRELKVNRWKRMANVAEEWAFAVN
jgi:hypothetical protein